MSASGEELTDQQLFGLAMLCLAVTCFDILGNITIIVVYAHTRVLHVASRCLIMAVSVADINLGIVDLFHVHPLAFGEWTLPKEVCVLKDKMRAVYCRKIIPYNTFIYNYIHSTVHSTV